MIMNHLFAALFVASLCLVINVPSAQETQKASSSERIIFYADDQLFNRSVPVPPKVITELLKTEEGKEGLEFASVKQKPVLADLFRAVEVHLGSSSETALVVGGIGAMSGADNDWFWIVQSPKREPKVILFCGGNSLEILKTKSGGFKDVRCSWSSPSETNIRIFRYAAGRYQLQSDKRIENK